MEREARSHVLDFPYERARHAYAAGLTPEQFRAELEHEVRSHYGIDTDDPYLKYRDVLPDANSYLTEWDIMHARATCVASRAASDFQSSGISEE